MILYAIIIMVLITVARSRIVSGIDRNGMAHPPGVGS